MYISIDPPSSDVRPTNRAAATRVKWKSRLLTRVANTKDEYQYNTFEQFQNTQFTLKSQCLQQLSNKVQ
jgi:hypothetical protein